jgi:hypothetical protein
MWIKPSYYSIRSQFDNVAGAFHPKNWVIETSNDRNNCAESDKRENNSDLNGRNVTKTFTLSTSADKCRYLQLH